MCKLLVGESHVTIVKEQALPSIINGPQFLYFIVFWHALSFPCKRVGHQLKQNNPEAPHIEFRVRHDFGFHLLFRGAVDRTEANDQRIYYYNSNNFNNLIFNKLYIYIITIYIYNHESKTPLFWVFGETFHGFTIKFNI